MGIFYKGVTKGESIWLVSELDLSLTNSGQLERAIRAYDIRM